jgi:alcohol dehydrogenase (cytochrome c)
VLDRHTGEFLTAVPYVKQTWADGLDAKGRPFARRDADPKVDGTIVYPAIIGAANWWSPSYSPRTRLFYQAAREMAGTYYKGDADYKEGTAYAGGGGEMKGGDDAYGAIRALEGTTGKLRWEFRLLSPPMAGLLSTAGGLVFGGAEEGNFFALDAENGKLLWELQLGAAIRANPISFAIDEKQQVAITAGNSLFVFGLP